LLQAMLDELGPPTFFLTLSPAEYDWADVKAFVAAVDRLHGLAGTRLADAPVEVVQQYWRRLDALFRHVIRAPNGPLGTVAHHYTRIEFQKVCRQATFRYSASLTAMFV
jgi:hypothetical protein